MSPVLRNFLLTLLVAMAIMLCVKLADAGPVYRIGLAMPAHGDWLCWVSKTRKKGTYGWHHQKRYAVASARKLCRREFGKRCKLEYCQKILQPRAKIVVSKVRIRRVHDRHR